MRKSLLALLAILILETPALTVIASAKKRKAG